MSADKLWRRACTAVLCGAFATILGAADSLSYMPIDRDSAVLRQPLTSTEEPGGVAGRRRACPALRRQIVLYATKEPAGTIIIDTAHTFLYLTLGGGKALRYGIGVGRRGFTWSGVERYRANPNGPIGFRRRR